MNVFKGVSVLILVVAAIGGFHFAFSPPADFPAGSVVSIARGTSVPDIAGKLADARIVAHPDILRFVLRVSGQSASVQAGTYLFNTPENVFTIAYRLAAGAYGLPLVRITFPEGETARDMAESVGDAFPDISVADFLSEAKPYEGYLFPDTYLFFSSADAELIVKTMRANFDAKTAPLSEGIAASGHALSDIVIMASLIEKEARSRAVKHMVSGILWNRLELGMPLQVDAVFGYIFNRDTYSPSFEDLKVDSPYNTYTHMGLPPGPISNPGLESLEAALYPTKTDYLYYLTGIDNVMYYATTYAGHKANRRKYLDI
ncbi:MAG: Endolytic murein transglycosylase [Syntrophomonadaceae bacterium]|nr:Endolytic murein transglycosylase [Bacillota bacterium]